MAEEKTKFVQNGDYKIGINEGTLSAITSACIKLTSQAKAFANFSQGYQTGQLKNSIMYRVGDKQKEGGFNKDTGKKAVQTIGPLSDNKNGFVGSNTDHSTYVEYGTRTMSAQPYLRPAADVLKGSSLATIKKKYNEAMKSALKRGKKTL